MPTDGIKTGRRRVRRTEALLDVAEFRRRFLHGIETKDNNGEEISNETYQDYIDMAISMLEHDLDIAIVEKSEVEEKDYHGNDYTEWGYFQLNNCPVLPFEEGKDSIQVTYLRDAQGMPENFLEIPISWIRLREQDGIIRLVPNNNFPANLQISNGGAFFPELFRRNSNVPQLWTIKYRHGFKDGEVPMLINTAIGLIAAILAFNNAADLLLGAGIASTSISLDGLSQSISSTASAENTTFSAKVEEYSKILFGEGSQGNGRENKGLIKILRNYYIGSPIQII